MHKIIEVIPNPYIALDKDGIPQGVVSAGMPGVFVGAMQDLVASQQTGKQRFYFPKDAEGSLKKKVHLTGDIVTSILAGELMVCDEKAAKACGFVLGPKTTFLAPEKALEAERLKALAYWQALHGDEDGPDKSAKIGEIPREPTKKKDDAPAPSAAAAAAVTPTVTLTKNKDT